jgi:hypothetical protein
MSKIKSQLKMLYQRGTLKYFHFLVLKIAKFFKIGFYFPPLYSVEVDIVYVVHTKDSATLPKSIQSLPYVKNITIRSIHVISNDIQTLKSLIQDERINFVNETDVVGFDTNRYPYPLECDKKGNRSGWLYQQFLKLGWATHSKTDNYIVVDSDTYFTQPISFFGNKGKFIFFGTEEWWPAYFEAFFLLFKEKTPALWSRTAHMMVFNKRNVLEMFAELELIHQTSWHEAIAKTRKINSHACYSEYETYANWMLLRHPEQCEVRPSYNINSKNPQLTTKSSKFNSVSNHSYL